MEKKNFWYSRKGKMLRGFFCLLAFGLFLVSGIRVVYGLDVYGLDNLFDVDEKGTFLNSREGVRQLQNGMYLALDYLSYTENVYEKQEEVSLIDVDQKKKFTYDLKELTSSDVYDEITDFTHCRNKSSDVKNLDSLDYPKLRKLLLEDAVSGDYIYFDEASFASLFCDAGYRNTNYRFSEEFSEDSYFLFDYWGDTRSSDEILKKIRTCDKKKSVGEFFNLDGVRYAVCTDGGGEYLYYGTEDGYFGEMGGYIYSVAELKETLEEMDEDGSRYDSIVPILLACDNKRDDWISDPFYIYHQGITAKKILEDNFNLKDTGMFYYLEYEDKILCSDEDIRQAIGEEHLSADTVREYLKAEDCAVYSFQINKDEDAQWDEDIFNIYEELSQFGNEGITDFVYGVYIGDDPLPNSMIQVYEKDYQHYKQFILVYMIVAVVMEILTIGFAVSLIWTTGRTYSGQKEVRLNFYDKLPGEIWWLITGVVLAVAFMLGLLDLELIALFLEVPDNLLLWECQGACCAVGFAFFVMIFVLSFFRRLKGYLVFRNTLCVKGISRLRKRFPAKKVKGAGRLIFFYGIFSGLTVIFAWLVYASSSGAPWFVVVLIQMVGLIGVVLFVRDTNHLVKDVQKIANGNLDYKVSSNHSFGIYNELTDNINHIGDGLKLAVEKSVRDERMKTELITNVSHDLKTPLTSIINYIELLKAEEMATEDAKHYIEVLDGKAQRLKQLTEDLVEAAKANSGNIELHMMSIHVNELLSQSIGEFEEKFKEKQLQVITNYPEKNVIITADGRQLYRVMENVLQNICKYAMPNTRVYIDLMDEAARMVITIKNVSESPLNISAEELMERFTRGDASRTTEGSGLGLSIAKDLTFLQGGSFDIVLDGDLFKVIIIFPVKEEESEL